MHSYKIVGTKEIELNKDIYMLSDNFLDINTKSMIVEEIFTNGNVLEIIKFLSNEYTNTSFLDDEILLNDEIFSNETILLDFNNDLIDIYLIRYSKSKKIFYHLLQKNAKLIEHAILNLNIIKVYDEEFIKILIEDYLKRDDRINLINLEIFFEFYIQNIEGIFFKDNKNYIDALMTKKDSFISLKEKDFIKLLSTICRVPKIKDIIDKENASYYNDDEYRTHIQENTWNLLCSLTVNKNTIDLFDCIAHNYMVKYNYGSLRKDQYDKYRAKEILEKWSNYEYPNEIDIYSRIPHDNNTKRNIQMLIYAYTWDENKELLKYDGVRALRYKYLSWYTLDEVEEVSIHGYIKFLQKNNKYEDPKDEMFAYFTLNSSNYSKSYFKEFQEEFTISKELVLKYFEKIDDAILVYSYKEIKEMLYTKNIDSNDINYYTKIYGDGYRLQEKILLKKNTTQEEINYYLNIYNEHNTQKSIKLLNENKLLMIENHNLLSLSILERIIEGTNIIVVFIIISTIITSTLIILFR